MHPFVLGELALGRLGAGRDDVLRDLARLPRADIVPDDEMLAMVDARRLSGSGIGWVDAHLVAAALVRRWHLWTFDGALLRVGSRLDVVVRMS
jgi:predicted nucleic acid-binding protein